VFSIVFSPTNELLTGQSVISSVTTVGVLRVSSALTNTVTVAPWLSASVDSTNEVDVTVKDVVNPFFIGGGDAVHSYVTSNGTFNVWERKGDGGWKNLVTVTTEGVSEYPSAEVATLEQGKAFWLVRNAPGPYIYLVGRYTGGDYVMELAGGSVAEPGHTLVANPTFFDVALNDLEFVDGEGKPATPAADDRIEFQDIAGMKMTYYRDEGNEKWGRTAFKKVGRRIQQEWAEDGTNTVGTGFWYYHTSTDVLKIKFEASK
jgi:hypothetical protein